jgi:TatD DNase family protein
MIDTHVHLTSSRFKKDRDMAIRRAHAAGVTHFVEVGYDVETSARSARFAAERDDAWATVGIHPHEAARYGDEARAEMERLARQPRVVAIGEVGLDFFRNLSPADAQREWFAWQLDLARRLDLPVVVHVRDAMDEVLDTLARDAPPRRGVLHCWSGDAAQARRAAGMGFCLGFGGTVTYGVAAYEESARAVPREAIVLETDAPYLVPMPKDVKRNEPALLGRVRARLAALRRESEEEVDAFTTENAYRVLALTPEPR